MRGSDVAMKRISFLIVILVYCTYGVTSVGEDLDDDRFESFGFFGGEEQQQSTISSSSSNETPKSPGGTCPTGSRLNGPPVFHCEEAINAQIHEELKASDIYLSMAAYFKRFDVSLPGFQHFFMKSSDEERSHAKQLMDYQNRRGGIVRTKAHPEYPIQVKTGDWLGALEATRAALDLEKEVLAKLKTVHKCGADNDDANLQDFIESIYLQEQYESIEELSNMVTKIARLGCGVGLHLFDHDLK